MLSPGGRHIFDKLMSKNCHKRNRSLNLGFEAVSNTVHGDEMHRVIAVDL